MNIVKNWNKKNIQKDILNLLVELFKKTKDNQIYMKKGHFWKTFIEQYPLKYQHDDKFIITPENLIQIVKTMEIACPFKFKKRNPKRYKFIRSRMEHYKK